METFLEDFQAKLKAVNNCLRELTQGRGGLNAYIDFARQITPPIQGLDKINTTVYANYVNWQKALALTNPETRTPPAKLEEEAFSFLGVRCSTCGGNYPSTMDTCPVCRGILEENLPAEAESLMDEGYEVDSRVLIILRGFEYLKEAYLAAYEGLRLILHMIASLEGCDRFTIGQREFASYLEYSRLFVIKGEQRVSLEQRQLLQLLVWGNLADAELEEVAEAFNLGVEVIKWGYLVENVSPQFKFKFQEAAFRFISIYQPLISRLQRKAGSLARKEQPSFTYEVPGGKWVPALLLTPEAWMGGKLSDSLTLTAFPLHKYVRTRQEMGSISVIFGPLGAGKTILLRALGQAAVQRGAIVFYPVSDDDNQTTLVTIPLTRLPRKGREDPTGEALKWLGQFKIEPKPLPAINLNFLRPGDESLLEDEPLTVYDRIVPIPEKLQEVQAVDFDKILGELGRVAREMGYSKTCGYINVRNLERGVFELELARHLIDHFTRWRAKHKEGEVRIQIDEIAELGGAAQIRRGGSSEYLLGGQIVSLLRRSRRKNISCDYSSQRISEVIHELREHATNIFFRDLGSEQMEALSETLQLEDGDQLKNVETFNQQGTLKETRFWWWYSRPLRALNLIQPCLPTHMIFDKNYSLKAHFQAYEEASGRRVLVEKPKVLNVVEVEASRLSEDSDLLG